MGENQFTNPWIDEELEILKSIYPSKSKEFICNILNRHTWRSIQKKAGLCGIKRVFDGKFKKGQVPPFKGKKGIHISPNTEFKKGHITWSKGLHLPEETKKKISLKLKEKYLIGVLHHPLCGKHHTNEAKKKISEKLKGKIPWNKGKSLDYMKKLWQKPEYRKRFLSGISKYVGSPEHKKHCKENFRKMMEGRLKVPMPKKRTKIEQILCSELLKRGCIFEQNYAISNICQPDFVFIREKIAVFADGDYWHNLPEYIKRDNRINNKLQDMGWKVLRFWGYEIKNNTAECVDKIIEVVNASNF
ncbi:MAG: DUF559 domain-containing protein [Candidatus Thermoplasmatota archaeon]